MAVTRVGVGRRLWVRSAAVLVGVVLVAAGLGVVAPPAVAEAGPAQWTATHTGAQRYPDMRTTPVRIPMSDGTVLYADLYRPVDARGRIVDAKLPVVVNLTPYTKLVSAITQAAANYPVLAPQAIALLNSLDLRRIGMSGYNDLVGALRGGELQTFAVDPQLVKSGYAQLVVDVRGTGTSQGTWQVFGEREQQDTVEVIDWASKQGWSNGRIGMAGVSYSAINQLQAGARRPPALKALFPVVPGADLVRDVVAPGGGMGVGFLMPWLALVNSAKFIPNLDLMLRGEFDYRWLADRMKDPATYFDVVVEALATRDVRDYRGETRSLLDADSERRRTMETDVARIEVPTFTIGAFNDLFTNSEWRMLQRLRLPDAQKKLVMNDGYHLTFGSNFGRPGQPPRLDVLQRAWFDKWLKGVDNGIDSWSPATVQSQPTREWTHGQTFPYPGHTYQRQYLTGAASRSHGTPVVADGSLSSTPPTRPAVRTVSPGISTLCSRDAAQSSIGIVAVFDACGRDSRVAETGALSFTTPAVKAATRISGPMTLHLNQRLAAPMELAESDSRQTDGYWAATVNAVAPNGQSTVVSAGQVVVSLREVDQAGSGRGPNGDLTDTRLALDVDRVRPVKPGQTVAVDIPMTATQATLPPGYRLRVDVYAFNAPKGVPVGPTLAASRLRPQSVVVDPNAPSWLNVPVSAPLP